jgi:predicted nucleic acid-binding protein
MRYLLDTNTVIAAKKGQDRVRTRLETTPLAANVREFERVPDLAVENWLR